MNEYKKYAGLIFDCDGTLTDSMPLHYESWIDALSPFGISYSRDRFYSMGGMRSEEIVRVLAEEQSVSVDCEAVSASKEAFFAERIKYIEAREDICGIARYYCGRIPVAVASGGDQQGVSAQLEQIGMRKYFEVIVTAEDTELHKPHPDVFLETARRLGVEPKNCIVFEDSPLGLEAAARASMDCFDVRDNSLHQATKSLTTNP
ncbi:Fructose-1-phosphate phosphatase YqaB [Novipirellula aureliae]|uniref:Fructose-1-phosphate phosphatase YqaB n=1 Tax=Novipirellula aureliae TaxID=2527966 RepID=A0A5C6EAN0_9BACT|nr:HAD family phosphatase [Novipirellula aureliae]TWU45918.1 Fructose-1-phosphate phosphatase YqaB [Novipirellula aureliae]